MITAASAPPEPDSPDWYQVDLERFHGPLDLLLHLIRRQDIDVLDIPIARITGQFVAAIREVHDLPLERAGEFLEMASQLVRIKLRMLFPARGGEDEDEDPRADLVRRLLEYEHFREAADLLGRAERERALRFARGYQPVRSVPTPEPAALESGWDDLWAAARELEPAGELPDPQLTMARRPIPIEEKIEWVLSSLERSGRVEFGTLVAPWGTRPHAVSSLLACLELARRRDVRMRQSGPFAPLWILPPSPP